MLQPGGDSLHGGSNKLRTIIIEFSFFCITAYIFLLVKLVIGRFKDIVLVTPLGEPQVLQPQYYIV